MTMSRSTKRRRSRAQAMAEFALVAPMFFLLLFAIIEGARFVFYNELLNNATREGARFAIVHGGHTQAPDGCAAGPPAPETAECERHGQNVREAVRSAALSIVDTGDLSIPYPIWTVVGTDLPDVPCATAPDDACHTGTNDRGNYVTVFVEYSYQPLVPILPTITISARSSLVINN
jgi:hypothetical protein